MPHLADPVPENTHSVFNNIGEHEEMDTTYAYPIGDCVRTPDAELPRVVQVSI